MLRMDAAFARMSVLVATAGHLKHQTGRAMTMADFMVYVKDEQPEGGLTLESAIKALGAKRSG